MMAEKPGGRSGGVVLIAVLALAQGAFGVLRSLQWIQIGSDLAHRGVLVLPMIGDLAFVLAAIVAILAVLYALFAWGLLARRGWARPLGLTVALVNLALAAPVLFGGEAASRALLVVIVPVILVVYLLAPAGRRALGVGQG